MFIHFSAITYCGTLGDYTIIIFYLATLNKIAFDICSYYNSFLLTVSVYFCLWRWPLDISFLCLFSRYVEYRKPLAQEAVTFWEILAYCYFKLFHIFVYICSAEGKYMYLIKRIVCNWKKPSFKSRSLFFLHRKSRWG